MLRAGISLFLLSVVIALILGYYGVGNALAGLKTLTALPIAVIMAALFANALSAVLRFKITASYTGHSVGFRDAMATVSAGSLAGAVFFQIAGQLMARGAVARRAGIPFATIVVVTAFERIVAAMVSALLGLAGAWFIFGRVYLDQNAGGAQLIKIMLGLLVATTGGALIGYGPIAVRSIAPFMTRHFARRCLGVIGLTFLVQIPMMIAYVVAAHSLSAHTPFADLIAASAVVMFAASVPISFAGWGVREMSAVVALGGIGMTGPSALAAGILVGVGSTLAMALIAAVSLPKSTQDTQVAEAPIANSIDYARALSWVLPLTAAVFVLFQIYVPVRSGLLNVGLADPVALLGGALFVITLFREGRLPQWRSGYINAAVVAMTLALGIGLLIGVARFGWTDWAWINRFLGWFILLAFAATGALIVANDGKKALQILLLTFIGATAGIALLDLTMVFANALGESFAKYFLSAGYTTGFAQNRNAFAFQLLMALAATLVAMRGYTSRIVVLTLMFVAFWFAGSRSAWITAVFVTGSGIYIGIAKPREIFAAIIFAAGVSGAISVFLATHGVPLLSTFPEVGSTHERMVSIMGGMKLFLAHPIFGAGLGAFKAQDIMSATGIPLVIHSSFVWLLAELGIAGFLAFAIPSALVVRAEWMTAGKIRASAAVVLFIVAFVLMSIPADMFYQRSFWLLIGAALAQHVQKPRRGTRPPRRRALEPAPAPSVGNIQRIVSVKSREL